MVTTRTLNEIPLERSVGMPGTSSRKAAEKVASGIGEICSNIFVLRQNNITAVAERNPKGGYHVAVIVPRVERHNDLVRDILGDAMPYAEQITLDQHGNTIIPAPQPDSPGGVVRPLGKLLVYTVPIGIYVR